MRVLIVGYGSIGKRHEEVLKSLDEVTTIDIVTKQFLPNKKTYKSLKDVDNLSYYDYFVIASTTDKHFDDLSFLEKSVENKLILCEKPLFSSYKNLVIENNTVYIGYVLRFHPLLQKLYSLVQNENIIYTNIICGQYLPTWRKESDYRDSYSAKKDQGGGVLLDLSHEIDYMQWLCGRVDEIKSYQVKISDLEINSDDLTTFIGKSSKGTIINLSIDYISKIIYRRVFLHTFNYSYELDFIQNRLTIKDKLGNQMLYDEKGFERNYMFKKMHKSMLTTKENLCSYSEAVEVMKTIDKVRKENHE